MTDYPGLDIAGLAAWLERAHPELVRDELSAELIEGGRSNVTYRIAGARRPLILRRPPLGHVLSSAHDMAREYRVITALVDSSVPVPPTVDLVDDSSTGEITGTPFFVMDLVEGRVMTHRDQNEDFTRAGLNRLGHDLAGILADLHSIDPAAVGLESFGRSDGYLARQLTTWKRQLDASRSREVTLLDRLQAALGERVPESSRSSLVHGDFRLDNALVTGSGDQPRISAILDWEMATLGDPLVDLGMLGLYWGIADLPGIEGDLARSAVDTSAGYPAFDDLLDSYAANARVSIPELSWYRAFAAYKLAVILEGIWTRFGSGQTLGEGFDRIGELVEPLAAEGLAHVEQGTH